MEPQRPIPSQAAPNDNNNIKVKFGHKKEGEDVEAENV